MKTKKKVKAQKMWADHMLRDLSDVPGMARTHSSQDPLPMSEPVFVLPATPEAYEAMIEQGAKALYPDLQPSPVHGLKMRKQLEKFARARTAEWATRALAAIGITTLTKTTK